MELLLFIPPPLPKSLPGVEELCRVLVTILVRKKEPLPCRADQKGMKRANITGYTWVLGKVLVS